MKRSKHFFAALLLLMALAATSTGCYYGKVCQAQKTDNHR
jgi:hypothetical protein